MKSTILALSLLAIGAAQAADLAVSAAYDPLAHRTGVRVEATLAAPVLGDVTGSFTRLGGDFDRFAVGKSLDLGKIGPVSFKLDGAGVYQRSDVATSGFGATVGAHAEATVIKDVTATLGIERFHGEHKLISDNGSILLAGVKLAF